VGRRFNRLRQMNDPQNCRRNSEKCASGCAILKRIDFGPPTETVWVDLKPSDELRRLDYSLVRLCSKNVRIIRSDLRSSMLTETPLASSENAVIVISTCDRRPSRLVT
jgi:hypothetical protein